MKYLNITVDEETHKELKRRADSNLRTLKSEVKFILNNELKKSSNSTGDKNLFTF